MTNTGVKRKRHWRQPSHAPRKHVHGKENNNAAVQSAHTLRLICCIIVHFLDRMIVIHFTCKLQCFSLVSVAEQACLSLSTRVSQNNRAVPRNILACFRPLAPANEPIAIVIDDNVQLYVLSPTRCSKNGIRPSGKIIKIRKRAKIRNRYNQAPHLTQDTNGKVTNSQLDIKNESQEASPFPAGDHRASIKRSARKHDKHKT